MSGLFLLTVGHIAGISLCFLLSHTPPRVDDKRVVSGIISVIKNGLQ